MSVTELWWMSLAIFAVVVVVVAVLLGVIIAAAKSIDRHASAIWTVGKQIAGNTVSIWMLEDAKRATERIEESVRSLERSVGAVDDRLRAIAGGGGR